MKQLLALSFATLAFLACHGSGSKGALDLTSDSQSYDGGLGVDGLKVPDQAAVDAASASDLASDDLADVGTDLASSADDLGGEDLLTLDQKVAAPAIKTFSGVASACPGPLELTYDFSGGTGVITPGNVTLPEGSGQADLTLPAATTQYTLTVTGPGGVATKQVTVSALAVPDATITAPQNAAVKEVVSVGVPSVGGTTYAWTVESGPGLVKTGATSAQATVEITAAGGPITLTATASNGTCQAVGHATIALPCDLPTLISIYPAATAEYVPNNLTTRPPDFRGIDDAWVPYLVYNTTGGYYDYRLTRDVGGVWGAPASTPHTLNDATHQARDIQIAGNDAGDAVAIWTQIDEVMLVGYHAMTDAWSPRHQLTNKLPSYATAVSVHMNRKSSDAIVSWIEGPFATPIPHLRHYDAATDTLGPDIPLRATTTNYSYFVDAMNLDVQVNDTLDGMVTWFEKDTDSGVVTLYAQHLAAGALDGTIVPLVIGGTTYTTDLLNQYSTPNGAPERRPRLVAVSANGNAAVMWKVFNGSADTDKGKLFAKRYLDGAWGANEVVAINPSSGFESFDWAIDDAGDMIVATLDSTGIGPAGYRFTHALAGGAWAALTPLGAVSGSSNLPVVAMDASSGRGVVTFKDTAVWSGIAARAAVWDPVKGVLGPSFSINDPTQSTHNGTRPYVTSTGELFLVFIQMANPLPVGANSSNSALLYANHCHPF